MLAGPVWGIVGDHPPCLAEFPGFCRRLSTHTIAITAEAPGAILDFTGRLGGRTNPHAARRSLGRDELELIQPVIEGFQDQPCQVVSAPCPPIPLSPRLQGEFDAVIAMYHDQGLIPIKLVHFHVAVM